MANEPTDTNTAADPRDAQIKSLQTELETLAKGRAEDLKAQAAGLAELNKQLKQALLDKEKAEKKAAGAKAAPTGDVVYLEGKTYPVVKTIRAHANDDEVKRGYVFEGTTLVVIDRQH